MFGSENLKGKKGGSKTFSIADDLHIISKKKEDEWGEFDEDWGFRVHDIPKEFRDEKKFRNFLLAKEEEKKQKLILDSKPYQIDFEPTNICNLHCPLCSTGIANTRKKGTLGFTNFKKIIDEIHEYVLQVSLQNWGESTLVSDLPKMIRYASEKNVFLRLSSNFSVKYSKQYLEDFITSGLGRLVIDIDGTTQEVYEKYRIGGDLKTVLENTKMAVEQKKKNGLRYPIIQARMLVTSFNEHQIGDFKTLSKDLGVDEMDLGNIQLNLNENTKKWLPKNVDYVYETYRGENRLTPCHWPWSGMVINWEGAVAPCAIVDDPSSDFGNVFKDGGIKNVWNNESYVSARSTWSKDKKPSKLTICNICKNDTHNPIIPRVGDSFSLTLNRKMISSNLVVKK